MPDKNLFKSVSVVFALLASCTYPQLCRASTLVCADALASITYHYERALLGLETNPYGVLKTLLQEKYGRVDASDPKSLHRFETEAIAVLDVPPNFQEGALLAFADRWGITREQALRVVDYAAATLMRDGQAPILGGTDALLARISAVAREHWLGDIARRIPGDAQKPSDVRESDRLAMRYPYYRFNLSRLSVPEIAVQRRVSEQEIYDDLSNLNLSVEASFHEPLTAARLSSFYTALRARGIDPNQLRGRSPLEWAENLISSHGWSEGEAATALGFGEQALSFIRHYRNDRNRGVRWTRRFVWNAQANVAEETIVRELHQQGRSAAQIADVLNDLAQTTDPAHSDYRTQQSVSAKLAHLNLTTPRTSQQQPNIAHPLYGLVKHAGKLVPENAAALILGEYNVAQTHAQNVTRLAGILGVTEPTVVQFIERHDVVIPGGRPLAKLTDVLQSPAQLSLVRAHEGQSRERLDQVLTRQSESLNQAKQNFTQKEGGITAFDAGGSRYGLLPGFSSDTLNSLKELAVHFGPETHTRFGEALERIGIKSGTGQQSLGFGKTGQPSAAAKIFEALCELVRIHNEWVGADVPKRGQWLIELKEFETAGGVKNILAKLRLKDLVAERLSEAIAEKFGLQTGGVSAFLAGSSKRENILLIGFGNNTVEALQGLAVHLEPAVKIQVSEILEQFGIKSTTGRGALMFGDSRQAGSAKRVFQALREIIRLHNEWVDKEPGKRNGWRIALSELETAKGVEDAVAKLRQQDPAEERVAKKATEGFIAATGGIAALRSDKKQFGLLPDFRESPVDALLGLAAHLEDATKTELKTYLEPVISESTGDASLNFGTNGQPSAAVRIFKGLRELIRHHNAWVAKDAANRKPFSISLTELETRDGVEDVIHKLRLKNPTEERTAKNYSEAFAKDTGGVSAFAVSGVGKRDGILPGFSTDTNVSLLGLAKHLPPAEQANLKTFFTTIDLKASTGGTSLGFKETGQANAANKVFTALREVIRLHNAWVAADEPNRKQWSIDLKSLETPKGTIQVIQRLRLER